MSAAAETVAAAGPADVESRLRDAIASMIPVAPELVTRDARIMADLGADSLDVVEIVMWAEETFGILVPDELAEECLTFGEVADGIVSLTSP